MPARRVLVLGGTRLARVLAGELVAAGHLVVTSLAGVTREPARPAGEVRIGGFGGTGGLKAYLAEHGVDLLVDATHPYAAQISRHAAMAAGALDLELVRLVAAPWQPAPGDDWRPAADTSAAVDMLPSGRRVLVTIGRKEIADFARRLDIEVVARMIEPPPDGLPAHFKVIRDRPPFSVDHEVSLMQREAIEVLVSKNAGGPGRGKLDAARQLGLPVVMIDRPALPDVPTVHETGDIVAFAAKEL